MYESLHIIGGVVYLVFGGLGSYYALKTLTILHKSPELSNTQRVLWLPILISTLLFAVGGVVHLADHLLYPDPLMDVLFEIVIIIGVSVFTVSVIRYSQMQIKYYNLKNTGLKQIRVKEPLQVERSNLISCSSSSLRDKESRCSEALSLNVINGQIFSPKEPSS